MAIPDMKTLGEHSEQDRLFETQRPRLDFAFDEDVARVFPDMIERSVPGYGAVINMISAMANRHLTSGQIAYDLGCSLGAASLAILKGLEARRCRIIAVDNAWPMITKCRENMALVEHGSQVELVCADVRHIDVADAAMVVLNFTLQFIPLADRTGLMKSIHEGMAENGVLVLSEKIASDNPLTEQLFVEMHHGFKKTQGYSDLEISQKRSALENVLIPETLNAHIERLRSVGFSRIEPWFQCFNFMSLLAYK